MMMQTLQYKNGQWNDEPLPELDSSQTWVLVFADGQLEELDTLTKQLQQTYPQSILMGCTTAGEIYGDEVNDASVSVSVVKFEHTQLRWVVRSYVEISDSLDMGVTLAQDLMAPDLKSIFVLSDGLKANGTQLVAGFDQTLSNVVLSGGLAGDGDRFGQTQVLSAQGWCSDQVVAVGFYGDHFQVGHGSRGGWSKFGPERQITHAEGNVLYELDGQPALALYKTYLGDAAAGLPLSALFFPMGLIEHQKQAEDHMVVRTILAVSEQDQSLTFAGDMPQDAYCQLMKANFEQIVDGAYDASEAVLWKNDASASLLVSISCVGRKLVLKEHVEEEVEAALSSMPAHTQQIGYYSYGEISPLIHGQCGFHNQTMTLTLFREMVVSEDDPL